jgi:phosphoribosylformimino-5-aminoimidazole carboxamide ribotide isomerase
MIVLELTSVGSAEGPAQQALLAALRGRLPDVELITGGGVRSAADLEILRTLGMDGVLVATALHHGGLDPKAVADD